MTTETSRTQRSFTVLKAGQVLDAEHHAAFCAQAKAVLETTGDLIVDLSAVEFIDSSGLAALLLLYKECAKTQRRLILCGLRPHARALIELTRLHRLFEIYEDLQAAMAEP